MIDVTIALGNRLDVKSSGILLRLANCAVGAITDLSNNAIETSSIQEVRISLKDFHPFGQPWLRMIFKTSEGEEEEEESTAFDLEQEDIEEQTRSWIYRTLEERLDNQRLQTTHVVDELRNQLKAFKKFNKLRLKSKRKK